MRLSLVTNKGYLLTYLLTRLTAGSQNGQADILEPTRVQLLRRSIANFWWSEPECGKNINVLILNIQDLTPSQCFFYRATLCVSEPDLCCRPVSVRLSVRPPRSCIVSRRPKISSSFFLDPVATSILVNLALLAKWLARKTPPEKPLRGKEIISTNPSPNSAWHFRFVVLFYCIVPGLYFVLLWDDIAGMTCWKCR